MIFLSVNYAICFRYSVVIEKALKLSYSRRFLQVK